MAVATKNFIDFLARNPVFEGGEVSKSDRRSHPAGI